MSEDPVRFSDLLNYWYTVRRPDRFYYCTPGLDRYKKHWDIVYSFVEIVSVLEDLYDKDESLYRQWLDILADAIEQFKPVKAQTEKNEIRWRLAFRRKYKKQIEAID